MPDRSSLRLTPHGNAVRFEVRAKPRSSRTRIGGVSREALDVFLAAPPVDGAANEALVEALASALGVGKRSVAIVRGDGSRSKLVEVSGLTEGELRRRIAEHP